MTRVRLTPKQSRFVDEYLIDLNATQAAIRAGYSEKTARQVGAENLSKPDIASAIEARTQERSERTQINADMVLQGILHNVRRCEQGEVVRNSRGEPMMIETLDGEMAVAYRYDASNALKGYEMLGKHLKLFTDRHEHEGAETVTRIELVAAEMERMEPEEASKLYREMLKEPGKRKH
ncbi:terminase small subunit [Halomonas aquatica]|uniref:Terminase small subunit n=1 Tax=Halomonas aquatica TaxID=3151123 RepID=A0ABV1NAE2_9GAMM